MGARGSGLRDDRYIINEESAATAEFRNAGLPVQLPGSVFCKPGSMQRPCPSTSSPPLVRPSSSTSTS
jgi:hypothetical protein